MFNAFRNKCNTILAQLQKLSTAIFCICASTVILLLAKNVQDPLSFLRVGFKHTINIDPPILVCSTVTIALHPRARTLFTSRNFWTDDATEKRRASERARTVPAGETQSVATIYNHSAKCFHSFQHRQQGERNTADYAYVRSYRMMSNKSRSSTDSLYLFILV